MDRLAEHTGAAQGVISTGELERLGFDDSAVARLVEARRLRRIVEGVYAVPGSPATDRQRLAVHLAHAGPESRLVLVTAAHDAGLLDRPPDVPQLGVAGASGVRHREYYDLYESVHAEVEPEIVNGLRRSPTLQILLQLAVYAGRPAYERMLGRAVRLAFKADPAVAEMLRREIKDHPRRRGNGPLNVVLDRLPGTEIIRSSLEIDFVAFLEIWGLPPAEMNFMLAPQLELDVAFIDKRLALELDTVDFHTDPIAFERDRRKPWLVRSYGWFCLTITGWRLRTEPEVVAAEIARELGLANWTAPANAARRWARLIADYSRTTHG